MYTTVNLTPSQGRANTAKITEVMLEAEDRVIAKVDETNALLRQKVEVEQGRALARQDKVRYAVSPIRFLCSPAVASP